MEYWSNCDFSCDPPTIWYYRIRFINPKASEMQNQRQPPETDAQQSTRALPIAHFSLPNAHNSFCTCRIEYYAQNHSFHNGIRLLWLPRDKQSRPSDIFWQNIKLCLFCQFEQTKRGTNDFFPLVSSALKLFTNKKGWTLDRYNCMP